MKWPIFMSISLNWIHSHKIEYTPHKQLVNSHLVDLCCHRESESHGKTHHSHIHKVCVLEWHLWELFVPFCYQKYPLKEKLWGESWSFQGKARCFPRQAYVFTANFNYFKCWHCCALGRLQDRLRRYVTTNLYQSTLGAIHVSRICSLNSKISWPAQDYGLKTDSSMSQWQISA